MEFVANLHRFDIRTFMNSSGVTDIYVADRKNQKDFERQVECVEIWSYLFRVTYD